ncbi:phage portal protein family protein [Verrucomicrobium spinosum]|uniref:phage portal protein family protein n=1 Tax=Verrucomicrobium spinosum TaxID=2736 RepID=UPI0009464A57|nr:hypothetical protein [Verrucomicrobium spinosum]
MESFGNDWSAVIYGDDGSGKIELVEAKANNSTLPFPSLIERADRKIAALYRGADLSTMSAGSGEAPEPACKAERRTSSPWMTL